MTTPSYFKLWVFSGGFYYAVQIDLSTAFFHLFFMDKLGKICVNSAGRALKISKISKFETESRFVAN